MIKILIIEDEVPARRKLKRFLEELKEDIIIVEEIDTVTQGINFLKSHSVDLIFSDIELLDGNSFEIYSQVLVSCPIIFTTAYNQFWMNAFEGNGIDYLVKPFSKERFLKAWDKFRMLKSKPDEASKLLINLTNIFAKNFPDKSYKMRFTIHNRQSIYFIETENITFFQANEGVVFAYDQEGRKHLLTETTLKEIDDHLNPSDFFRINRSELISKKFVEKIERYNKNTLAIKIKGFATYLKTSQSSTSSFREWISN